MTEPKENGTLSRRTALALMDVCVSDADLIARIVEDILDGPPFHIALRCSNRLQRNNLGFFDVQASIADGALSTARVKAAKLARKCETSS